MTASLRFHPPCLATSTKAPPTGSQWVHQPKLDGYRLQAVKEGRTVRLYTKGGNDWANKLTALADALAGFPARSAVLDCEMVMADASGLPDFTLLHKTKGRHRGAGLHLYAFDILHLNGKDLRDLPLIERARRLAKLLSRSTVPVLHLVPSFPDGGALLRSCEQFSLEGIVSKRADRPYRSGPSRDWLKSNCSGWKAANQERWRMFQSSLSSDKS